MAHFVWGPNIGGVAVVSGSTATARAHRLVMSYGSNATACQILNPGISLWFHAGSDGTEQDDAVVGFVRRHSWVLVAGEPVCSRDNLRRVTDEFETWAQNQHLKVCYVCAADSLRDLLMDSDRHAAITMGAQPVWNPAEWPGIVRRRGSLRAQLNRSRNKGIQIESMNPAEGAHNEGIARTLSEWLESRRMPPMHFLVEPQVLDGMTADRLLFVARREATIVAFLVASPVVARNGYLVEELARSPRAPNGTAELLIDAAMARLADQGCSYVTMGLVALASEALHENPPWLRTLMYIARAHANRFYNFRGLEQFRTKMQPAYWEKIYAISRERNFSPQALYAMGGAFSGISPLKAIGLAIAKGAAEELRRAVHAVSPSAQ
jgi:phosphatidylglycerol lysyltransferase